MCTRAELVGAYGWPKLPRETFSLIKLPLKQQLHSRFIGSNLSARSEATCKCQTGELHLHLVTVERLKATSVSKRESTAERRSMDIPRPRGGRIRRVKMRTMHKIYFCSTLISTPSDLKGTTTARPYRTNSSCTDWEPAVSENLSRKSCRLLQADKQVCSPAII